MTFAKALRQAPLTIRVSDAEGSRSLEPNDTDLRYADRPYGEGYTEGEGTRHAPFRYRSAASVSPHYAIIDLWWRFRSRSTAERPVFIQVNSWCLRVTPEGVVAENGDVTRLATN
ncbi:MAG TPA: hypothetical protein VKT78_00335 [Fimbriimonadaceae bacterium]|nr:hypothetical protein [Fimbriimonadaceae bacterium]